jgi:hypothetical protein
LEKQAQSQYFSNWNNISTLINIFRPAAFDFMREFTVFIYLRTMATKPQGFAKGK